MNKNSLTIIGVVIVIGPGLLLLGNKKTELSVLVKEVCFIKKTWNDVGTTTTDIRAELYNDSYVKGHLNFTSPEKDSLIGNFTGTWKAGATAIGLDVVHNYFAEGINATTTRTVVINDDYALIDWDGHGDIEISSEQIPKVLCP